jgi:hypothetical protein
MNNKLPMPQVTIESMTAKPEAVNLVDNLIKQNTELSAIYDELQPLLYELSLKLYGDNSNTVQLATLVADSIKLIKGITPDA